MADNIHLHIGLGRIGLGLVLGLLCENLHLVIAQRCSKNWEKYKKLDYIELSNNKGYKQKAKVVYIKNKFELDFDFNKNKTFIILYEPDIGLDALNNIIPSIKYITTSIKDENAQKLVAEWIKKEGFCSNVILFPFENIIHDELLDLNSRIKVVKTMPDRVCTDIKFNKNSLYIDVEEYFNLIINTDIEECTSVFKENENIIFANSECEYKFLYNKKRRLVNSIHFFLALLSYDSLRKRNIPEIAWRYQYMPYLLSSFINKSSHEKQLINMLINAQAIRCVLEAKEINDQKAIERIFNGCNETQLFLKLIEYSNNFLYRCNQSSDLINRVLNFDALLKDRNRNKYNEHIKELRLFINAKETAIDEFPSHYKHWRHDILDALYELIEVEHRIFESRIR